MIEQELEQHSEPTISKSILARSITTLLLVFIIKFLISRYIRSIEISPTDVSIGSIAKIVIYFVIIAAVFFMALRNLFVGIRRMIINKMPINIVSIVLSLVSIVILMLCVLEEAKYRL